MERGRERLKQIYLKQLVDWEWGQGGLDGPMFGLEGREGRGESREEGEPVLEGVTLVTAP